MTTYNTIVIAKDRYKTQEGFEKAIKDAVMLLLDNDYIMVIRYDEPGLGIVCIDYNYADTSYGTHYPYWLSPSEIEQILFENEPNTEEEAND